MAKKPTAVRGKTTKKSKMKKTLAAAVKGLKAGIKGTAKSKLGKSPGAMGGKMSLFEIAKSRKPSGRLNVEDMKRAKQILDGRMGAPSKPKRRVMKSRLELASTDFVTRRKNLRKK